MEVGDNSGYYSTGYESSYDNRNESNTVDAQFSSTFYGISNLYISDNNYSYNIELVHVTGNSWTISHVGGSSQTDGAISTGAGSITLSNTLDKLRIKTLTGLNFDNGDITVYYQTEGTVGSSTGGTSSGSDSSSTYESSILSFNGTNQVEFTDIPSWATKITLVGENILLPQPNTDAVGSLLEFGGSSGYLAPNSYAYNLQFETRNTNDTESRGLVDTGILDSTPYADFIVLYGAGDNQYSSILSQIFITFQKVKGENKWVFKGSASNRQGDPNTTIVDYKWLNNFTGSFTATEAITKLKFYSYEGAQHAAGNVNYTGGSVTAIYEGEGSSSSSSSSGGGSIVKLGTVTTNTGTEAAFTNIPSTAKKITVAIHNFGYAGTISDLIMHVGDSTGYYTSTNDYQSSYDNRDLDPNARSRTDAYGLADSTANDVEYNITVELVNVTGNSWTISHTGGANASSGALMYGGGLSLIHI